ncbi:helix-turn-helix domain-containing protein [Micromonospora olivasterospora]|nr:helix-turn-helix domain-containing protein [Micromonospora olivasterospora]
MDWQPPLTVARTDAGTIHTGDTPHHPTDEPPTTPAPLHPHQPQPTASSRQVRHPDEARALFDQHADHIATTTAQRDQLRQLWHALIDRMDDNGTITATESDLAKATATPQQTVHDRIGILRDRGLLQRVQEAHRGGAARYGVSDPGRPRQAPLPAPALGPNRPQGEDLSWLDHGATAPIPGPAPASPTDTSLPQLPGPWDDPDAPTTPAWPTGWAEPAEPMGWAEPGWPVPGTAATHEHGAAISTDPGQPSNQAGQGSDNLDDWATHEMDPADLLDVDPADLLYLLEAVGTEPDPERQPMHPPRPQTPPRPTSWPQPNGDQPSQSPGTQSIPPGPGTQNPAPQSPTPEPVPGMDVTHEHGAAISTDFGQPSIDDQADYGSRNLDDWADDGGNLDDWAGDGGNLGDWAIGQGPDMDWQPSLTPPPAVTHTDAGTIHTGDTPHHPTDEPPTTPAPLHPDQPQPTAGSRQVRHPDEARALFDQHADHIATTTSRPTGRAEPAEPDPGMDVTDEHGAAISTHPGQPSIDDQADDGGGNLGDWAIGQGPDMDWQPSLTPPPAVTHTDAGTIHTGDTPHHPTDEPPTTPAPLHPDQPQPTATSRQVRHPDEARALFDQHANHIATTTSRPTGRAEPAEPDPGTDVTDEHGAAISTHPGQPNIDDQADDGGGNLGDWAIGQGPDMDWQPPLTPPPAVTHTDAGTIHTGDAPTTPPTSHPPHPPHCTPTNTNPPPPADRYATRTRPGP